MACVMMIIARIDDDVIKEVKAATDTIKGVMRDIGTSNIMANLGSS